MDAKLTVFMLKVCGQIENAQFESFQDIYCKYGFSFGQDWAIISKYCSYTETNNENYFSIGLEEGITQTTHKDTHSNHFTFNFPLDISFKSTNPFGWPQIILHTYGYDIFGRDVVRGYGVCHLPVTPGNHIIKVPMFVPESSSIFQTFISWLYSRRPEFVEPKVLSKGDGREVTRVRSQGNVFLHLNVVLKDLKKCGYDTGIYNDDTKLKFDIDEYTHSISLNNL
ncbi:B9 domain-containing protein 1 [Intoshia linei]|uniref:B9 domain-containing protein 1 n=1 Tax=Intoshia linei TaxID=1819745 RepID=A0A177B0D2_9BILA|nr:B9 domain-containing protein 1 [Intoshia linei]